MSDFKNDLRRYIDGLERPVSVHETMTRQQERRRFRAPAAVLAGAAIVMIPAMVLIGIRFFPGDDGDVAQTTAPAISATSTTVTESTTTTTAAPSSFVTVPDIVGLSLERAEEVLASLGLELEVIEMRPSSEFTGISAQDPAGSTSVAVGSTVIVDVYVPPSCVADGADIPNGSMGVTVLFQCGTSRYPDIAFPITRAVPEDTDVIAATLRALLAGPTETERANGYESFFSPESAGALNSATVESGRLTVDFNDDILIGNASTSNGSLFFVAELQANLFQFPEVDSIEFRLNGSCDAFFGWLQGECQETTRAGWADSLDFWRSQNQAQPQPGRELEPAEVIGLTVTGTLLEGSSGIDQLNGEDRFDSGFDEIGGWLLDNARDAELTNWALHVAGQGIEMLWLVESKGHTDEGNMIYNVRAAVELPWDEVTFTADPFVKGGTDDCTVDGAYSPTLVTMALGGGTEEMDEVMAWNIDIAGATFQEIAVDRVECFMETGG